MKRNVPGVFIDLSLLLSLMGKCATIMTRAGNIGHWTKVQRLPAQVLSDPEP